MRTVCSHSTLLLPALLLGLGLLSPYLALLAAKEHMASWPLSAAIVVAGIACLIGFLRPQSKVRASAV